MLDKLNPVCNDVVIPEKKPMITAEQEIKTNDYVEATSIATKKVGKKWSRKSIATAIGISTETLYKWELILHQSLLELPHSFKVWEYLILQQNNPKRQHPPLDNYQIECLLLLGELRSLPNTANIKIENTIADNSLQFYELHQLYSPLHIKQP